MGDIICNLSQTTPDQRQRKIRSLQSCHEQEYDKMQHQQGPTVALGARKRVGLHPCPAGLQRNGKINCACSYQCHMMVLVSGNCCLYNCLPPKLWKHLQYFSEWKKNPLEFVCVLVRRRHLSTWRELTEAYKSLKSLQVQVKQLTCTEPYSGNLGAPGNSTTGSFLFKPNNFLCTLPCVYMGLVLFP